MTLNPGDLAPLFSLSDARGNLLTLPCLKASVKDSKSLWAKNLWELLDRPRAIAPDGRIEKIYRFRQTRISRSGDFSRLARHLGSVSNSALKGLSL